MSIFSENERPEIIDINSYISDGFNQKKINIFTHTGTHIDYPLHLSENGKNSDDYCVNQYVGAGYVIDCQNKQQKEILQECQNMIGQVDFLLFNFGWDKVWGQKEYVDSYPFLDDCVIDLIINSNLKGIGIDTINLDKKNDFSLKNHKKILNKDMIIVENLTNLDKCHRKVFDFVCLPLKLEKSDGAPCRAIAII